MTFAKTQIPFISEIQIEKPFGVKKIITSILAK